MSAKDESSARLTPIIAAYPKVIIPLGTVIPGMAAILLIPGLGTAGGLTYNDAIPALYRQVPAPRRARRGGDRPAGRVHGRDGRQRLLVQRRVDLRHLAELHPPRPPGQYYLRVGRITTVVGVFIGIGTAFIAAGYSNIGNYFQALFSFFNVPIFVAFIVGMFWRKVGRGSGFYGLIVGTVFSFGTWLLYKQGVIHFRSDIAETQWGAIIGFLAGAARDGHRDHLGHAEAPVRVAGPGLGIRGRRRGRGPRDGRPRALVQVPAAVGRRRARPVRAVLHLHRDCLGWRR